MIIFLYGQDSYRTKQKLDEIVNHYKETGKSWLNLMYIDASQIDFEDFHNNFKISSMFSETKLMIFKNVFSSKKFQEKFLEKIKEMENLKDVIVVYEKEEIDQRLKLFKVLIKECKSQEFTLLDGKGMKNWATKELEKSKIKMNMDALDLLLSYVGSDLWRVSGELKKLANFKNGLIIKKEDVQLLVKPKLLIDIFKTIDSLAKKDKKQALSLLHKHLDGDDSPLYILSMITYQFKNLLIVKELQEKGLMYASIVKKSGLHPFVIKKNYFQCRQFSFLELKEIYRKIFKMDSDIKTGKIEPETALDILVSEI